MQRNVLALEGSHFGLWTPLVRRSTTTVADVVVMHACLGDCAARQYEGSLFTCTVRTRAQLRSRIFSTRLVCNADKLLTERGLEGELAVPLLALEETTGCLAYT